MALVSRRTAAANDAFDAVRSFYFDSRYGERRGDPDIADFTFGNPHEMPLAGLVTAIREGALPQNKDWFAYKTSEEAPQADRQSLRDAMFGAQMALGWCFPNAVMQYAVPHLEQLSIDTGALVRRRDVLSEALRGAGHAVLPPEGTFYLWVKWAGDPERQWNALADRGVFVMPGALMNAPDYFRISLTASDEMVARAVPAFAQVG